MKTVTKLTLSSFPPSVVVELLGYIQLFCNPLNRNPSGSSVHGLPKQNLPQGDLPDPGIKSLSSSLAGRFFTTEPPGKPFFFCIRWESLFFYPHIKLMH